VSGWRGRLRDGLARSREGWVGRLSTLAQRGGTAGGDVTGEMEELLLAADLGPRSATEIASLLACDADVAAHERSPMDLLREELLTRLAGCERTFDVRADREPTVVLVAGVNGAGKTTTIAKLAAQLREHDPSLPLTFAAADTFRAAAAEQLGVWAERVGADLVRQQPGADPAAVVFDALSHAMRVGGALFIDTAGRLQTRHNLMEELSKVERTVGKRLGRRADERLLVMDATTGQNGVHQAKLFHEAIGLTGVVLTKLDGTSKGGIVLGVWETLGVPLMAIGVGEGLESMRPFCADEFVDALLGKRAAGQAQEA